MPSRIEKVFLWEKHMPISADIVPGLGGGWSNDHSFNSSAAVFGFYEFTIPEVKTEHPTWDSGQVQHEALVRWNLRLSEGLSFDRNEKKGEDTVKVWREEEHEGEKVLVIHGGAYDGFTLDRLWGQTGQFAQSQGKLDAVDMQEYKAQKTFQKALLSGEITSTASIIGHPKDVKVFQSFFRGNDGLFYAHQIDLEKATGRTLTFAESKTLMAKLHERYEDKAIITEARHDHFMLKDTNVDTKEVKMIARAIVMTAPLPQKEARVTEAKEVQPLPQAGNPSPHVVLERVHQLPQTAAQVRNVAPDAIFVAFGDTARHVSRGVAQHTKVTAQSVYSFLEKRGRTDQKKATATHPVRPDARSRIKTKKGTLLTAIIASARHGSSDTIHHFETLPSGVRLFAHKELKSTKAVEKSLARHKKKEVKKLKSKERTHSKMIMERKVGLVGKKSEIFAGHTKKKEKKASLEAYVSFSMERKRGNKRTLKKDAGLGNRREMRVRKRILLAHEVWRFLKKEKNKKSHKEVVFRKKNGIKSPVGEVQSVRLEHKRRSKQLVSVLIGVRRRLRIAEKNSMKMSGMKKESSALSVVLKGNEFKQSKQPGKQKELRRKQKEAALQFSFATILWMLLKRSPVDYVKTPKQVVQSAVKQEGPLLQVKTVQIIDREWLIEPEPTAWILLSIIWYLTMLREGGVQQPQKAAVQFQHVKKYTKIARSQVLYVYAQL
jgi:hypothetical protein